MSFDIWDLQIPEFDWYLRQPKDTNCKRLETKSIVAEILGWEKPAWAEIMGSDDGEKVLLEGDYSVVLRYKREKNKKHYPAVVMWFDTDEKWNIIIRHIQWVKQNRISYRFWAWFDTFGYFTELIKQNFTDKWLQVSLPVVPTNLEWASYSAQSPIKYQELAKKLDTLNASILE